VIRRGASSDVPFMRDMLTHAYYWRWGTPEAEDIPTSRYVDAWGRPGDTAVIALDGGFPVGAAWYRTFSKDAPGFGYVDAKTPELTVAVVPSKRGKGLGEQLLTALLERARDAGHETISLSVERANPARKLYERFGFREVDERGDTVVMVAELDGG
jgi:ribosomal protein S18 acetylase RimI-like enzyme